MGGSLTIGCHLSSAKGYLAMAKTAAAIGADTSQCFSRNPRGGSAKAIDPADVAAFRAYADGHAIGQVLVHAPYTLNPAACEPRVREFADAVLQDDLARMEDLPSRSYNLHPGSHCGQGIEQGIARVIETFDRALTPEQSTMVLLETMAGKGSEVGGTFEELRTIIEGVGLSDHLGVCLDTCHIWDAGYDIVADLDGVLAEFDEVIGIERLKAIHLNDSQNPRGSHRDRHARIGEGCIGFEALSAFAHHPSLQGLPFYLETPGEPSDHAVEIARLRKTWEA